MGKDLKTPVVFSAHERSRPTSWCEDMT